MSEKEQEEKIQSLYNEIRQTNSQKRKNDLNRYLRKLKKELQIYRQIRYNKIEY